MLKLYWRALLGTLWARMFGDMRRLYAWREQLQEVSCSVKGGPLDFYIPLDAQLPETKGGASCSSKSVFLCGREREGARARARKRERSHKHAHLVSLAVVARQSSVRG